MRFVFAILFAATFEILPMPQTEGPLEPSVQNEVDYAVGRAEAWLEKQSFTNKIHSCDLCKTNATISCGLCKTNAIPSCGLCKSDALPSCDLFKTNGLSREAMAVSIVSQQRSGGWWITETNSAPTRLAVKILKHLSE